MSIVPNSINHYNSLISRLGTGREWRGKVIRKVLEVISEQIQGITDELIIIATVESILFGEDFDVSTLLNDEMYTLGSENAMIGEQTEGEGRLSIWEFILDLLPLGTIEERLNAIIQAIINAGSISLIALQNTLQDNGFGVYVYRNGGDNAPGSIITLSPTTNHGGIVGLGGPLVRCAGGFPAIDPETVDHELCANYIDVNDDLFYYGSGYTDDPRRWRYGFFIGGENYLERAEVTIDRKAIFRELILKCKPGSMWALLLIDYV